jgi:patatin-like phospholipase/acyl hydrolase
MPFKILCCDGGGIRGLITSLLIQDLDRHFDVIKRADGFAGTSTGGLIALSLANGIDIDQILDIYRNKGPVIFEPNSESIEEKEQTKPFAQCQEELNSGPGLFNCQYKNNGLRQIACGLFGYTLLNDVDKYVAVNTTRLWDRDSWGSVTFSNSPDNPYSGISMFDSALATSAVPTYFPPHKIDPLGYFADGGTFANNPSVTAVADVISSGLARSLDDVRVLSLGTGISPQGIAPTSITNPQDWGATHWMWPYQSENVPAMALMNLMMDCTAKVATSQASQLLAEHFCRGNLTLPMPVPMDDWQHVCELNQYTKIYMETNDWKKVRNWVETSWD